MGERATPTERHRLMHRQRMRIRTIVVSFGAAVSSARRDLEVGPAERDALIETWRAWSLDVLERYGRDIEQLGEGPRSATATELEDLRSAVRDAIDRVRQA